MHPLRSGKISEICNRYQISQAHYYRWRDEFFAKCHKIFEMNQEDQQQQRLKKENTRLKTIIGELTTELKNTSTNEAEKEQSLSNNGIDRF